MLLSVNVFLLRGCWLRRHFDTHVLVACCVSVAYTTEHLRFEWRDEGSYIQSPSNIELPQFSWTETMQADCTKVYQNTGIVSQLHWHLSIMTSQSTPIELDRCCCGFFFFNCLFKLTTKKKEGFALLGLCEASNAGSVRTTSWRLSWIVRIYIYTYIYIWESDRETLCPLFTSYPFSPCFWHAMTYLI